MGSRTKLDQALQSNKHDYTRLYQVILRRRTYHFCTISYLLSNFVLWFVMLDGLPALWNGLRITTWIMAGANWASATIPLMTLRRLQLTAPSLYAPNRYAKFWAVLKSTEFITSTIFCSISGSLLCFTYVSAALALNENPDLGLLKSVPGRGVTQINERPIFLLASCLYTALCYSFSAIYHGQWHYRPLDVSEHLTIPQRIWKAFSSRIELVRRSIIYCSATFLPIYLISRRYLIRAIIFSKYTQLTKHIKPHMVMLIKFDSIFTLTSIIRLVMINVMLLSMWEIVQALWDVYSSHPLDLSRFDTEPNQCLLEGIRSTDPRVKHFAIRELAHISWSDPARRSTIFKDIRTSPRLLNLVIEECLGVIDNTKAMIESGDGLNDKTPVSTTQISIGARKPSPGSHSALKTDLPQIFNSSSNPNSMKQVLLKKLLSSESDQGNTPPSSTPSQLATPTKQTTESDYQIPDIFKRSQSQKLADKSTSGLSIEDTSKPSPSSPSPAQAKPSSTPAKRETIVPKIWQILLHSPLLKSSNAGPRLESWLFSPSITDELEKHLSNRQLCMFSVEAVTNFTCASLTEDQYGVLQDQIPRIMESLVDCFDALDQFRVNICAEFGVQTSSIQDRSSATTEVNPVQIGFHLALDEHLHPLLTRLKAGIFGITDQFKPFLQEISFSPKINQWIKSHPR
ncbi:hypothetical protein H4Q26_003768 [Puccinia striiformis f. sp. tritici PST-130]|uniref:Nucleoporin NDC1 n=1 Tax=Puccinia striiformis f. sp. tritici PST-78 TaxID=1165861 RepID=A0A0L0VAW3_9BASI|nr:hypothetical protein Pst134EB_014734 [Puccinia striiformis f. sp. tritici]KAI9604156.1 hypothetical protein H4Q26_003768 [Puccinia striiformis f. sp. tritici PST-130]KNE96413.1 hypothetical protein PSTG_10246 [Puccinia striiformis f. sp. tritici PST-78]KNE96426.1 hypothetical protein PSTG_10257 [Puccinia striiformis f. sp. tritici PST-78]